MVELQIDGRKVEVLEGSMVMHAAEKLDIYVPHFCYHKKLSIAANCRMCLVDIEKAPKPSPACATPVTNGMKVSTRSEKAVKAQKAVMEFLLVNHPLDCPICDQGGECQLQDLAVGYGGSQSRYAEEKRVVFHKSMGPLISAEEMSRCIHCTRCVRFGQEIAGIMELGMAGRGEHSEIMSFVGRSVDSELSGNMIDICPVGALTSRPFRYLARTWELARRRSIAPHDSLGSNLVVQVKNNRVMRVVPAENESVNECWLSDRDRFSYEALNAADRLLEPMVKQDGKWQVADWTSALRYASHALSSIRRDAGAQAIGALASPTSTLEELTLLSRLVRGLGGENIDTRLRQVDFAAAGRTAGAPWLGMRVEDVGSLDRALIIGSFLRKDHPLFAARVRQAVKRGCQVSIVHAVDDDLLMPLAAKAIVAPSAWEAVLEGVAVALCRATGREVPAELSQVSVDAAAQSIAQSLSDGSRRAVWLGVAATQQPNAARLAWLAQSIARTVGATFGFLGEAANTVGAWLAGAAPGPGGLNAAEMVAQPLKAYLLLNVEPSMDHAAGRRASGAIAGAQTVIAFSAFASPELLEIADCLLPIAPFTETSGTFVNCEGRAQSFNGVVLPAGQSRPGWKVLRVLGDLLELPGFDRDSSEAVRDQVLAADFEGRLNNAISGPVPRAGAAAEGIERIADIPIYAADMLVRRAPSLQRTRDAAAPGARANGATIARLGLVDGEAATFESAAGASVRVEIVRDDRVAEGVVRLAGATAQTCALESLTGRLQPGGA